MFGSKKPINHGESSLHLCRVLCIISIKERVQQGAQWLIIDKNRLHIRFFVRWHLLNSCISSQPCMSQNKQNKHCVLIVITAAACIIAEIWATLCMLHVFLAYPLSVKVISNYSSLSSAFLIFPVLFSIVKHYFQFMNCKFKIILRKWVILKQYYIFI